MAEKNIIEVINLTKRYDDHVAVDHVSYSVKKGECFGVLGPNGAGKTSMLEMMETIREIDDGTAVLNGINVAKYPRKVQKIIGVQLQASAFLLKLTLEEQLKLFAGINGSHVDIDKLLEEFDLTAKRKSYVENLSGGQKQRFSIATALVHQPKVLFLDEPTTGLDPQARRNLWDTIKKIKSQGVTIILTTHYMDEAEILCDRVAIMDNGKILTIDTPRGLIKDLLRRGFQKEQVVEQANLEDVFIDLTGKELRR